MGNTALAQFCCARTQGLETHVLSSKVELAQAKNGDEDERSSNASSPSQADPEVVQAKELESRTEENGVCNVWPQSCPRVQNRPQLQGGENPEAPLFHLDAGNESQASLELFEPAAGQSDENLNALPTQTVAVPPDEVDSVERQTAQRKELSEVRGPPTFSGPAELSAGPAHDINVPATSDGEEQTPATGIASTQDLNDVASDEARSLTSRGEDDKGDSARRPSLLEMIEQRRKEKPIVRRLSQMMGIAETEATQDS